MTTQARDIDDTLQWWKGWSPVSDQTLYERYRAEQLADPEFRDAYERARAEIDQIDQVISALDHRREELGMSKAALARAVGAPADSIRRLFSADSANPTLKTLLQLAHALRLELILVPEPAEIPMEGQMEFPESVRRAAAARRSSSAPASA